MKNRLRARLKLLALVLAPGGAFYIPEIKIKGMEKEWTEFRKVPTGMFSILEGVKIATTYLGSSLASNFIW